MATITVVTTKAKSKILRAHAGISSSIPPIMYMAFGDGGKERIPTGRDNNLVHELLRKEITGREEIGNTQYRYKCLLGTEELHNSVINELGLVDAEGDLV